MKKQQKQSFSARGGWWVVAQIPLLLLAYLIPRWTGQGVESAMAIQSYAALALLVAGALFMLSGLVNLGRSLTPFPQPLPKSQLRTGGSYALVRHPIYTGILFMAFGWALFSHSLAGLLFGVVVFVFFDRKAAREERWLEKKFSAYAGYRQRVKKLIPWIY
jgi:protein-S-isoprenylcysteine O-methyltransferase Ste14